jgi:predicted protein tyrosine phosphatase
MTICIRFFGTEKLSGHGETGVRQHGTMRQPQSTTFSNNMRHLLFLCSRNKLRSPTAEAVFAGLDGIEVDSAGLSKDAVVPLSEEQLQWADVIIVMEPVHRSRLTRNFKHALAGKRIVVLNIPDNYEYMDEALIRLLKQRCQPYLP